MAINQFPFPRLASLVDGEGGDDEARHRVQPCCAGQCVEPEAEQGRDTQQRADPGLGRVGEDESVATQRVPDAPLRRSEHCTRP